MLLSLNNILESLNKFTLDQIRYFFSHYKDLENKKVTVKNFVDANEAVKIYTKSIERYNEKWTVKYIILKQLNVSLNCFIIYIILNLFIPIISIDTNSLIKV